MKKVLLFLLFFTVVINVDAQRGRSRNKDGEKIAIIVRHPDVITLKGGDDSTWYYFFQTSQGLFFTNVKEIVDEIVEYLPAIEISGRYVEIGGTSFIAFTKFNKKQLDYLSRRAGMAINKFGRAVRISSHSLKVRETIYTPPKASPWGN